MTKDKKINNEFKIDHHDLSGLSAFIKRPVPSESEVEDFDEVIDKEIRHQEIDANLNEIYSDKKGELVNVKKMKIRKKSGLIVRIFKKLVIAVLLLLAAYFVYINYFTGDSDLGAVNFSISAPEKVLAGQEFSYVINYKNLTKFAISQIKLELNYPENFVFTSSDVSASSFNNSFDLPSLAAGQENSIEIRGMIIAENKSVNVVTASLHYLPVNFSSHFKKESSVATVVSGIGYEVGVNYPNLIFVGQSGELILSFSNYRDNQLEDIVIEFEIPESTEIDLVDKAENNGNDLLKAEGPKAWILNTSQLGEKNLVFKYLAKQESSRKEIILRLKKRLADGQSYTFYEENMYIEVVRSDLNISLFLNGSKSNQAVSFGDNLNYTLNYSNKGDSSYKDAVITAVFDGNLFDFSSLTSDVLGDVRSTQIIWNQQDIETLGEIKPGDEGEINFSIKIKKYSTDLALEDMEVSVYSQYGGDSNSEDSNNKSNVIISSINSNLNLVEQIRYFDDNNMPVGSGPLPPKVNETTSFRVYWQLQNNLHEIRETEVSLILPDYVNWDNFNSVSVGNLYYNESSREVVWEAGRLPAAIDQAEAYFSISLTPQVSDLNKILVLSSGATVKAIDTETKEEISSKSNAKTTKLEDDEIAALNNSGRVE